MRTTIKRQLYILYLIVIAYNIVTIHCEISDADGPDIVNDIPDALIRMQFVQSEMDGSGDTSEPSTEITMTSIETNKPSTEITMTSSKLSTEIAMTSNKPSTEITMTSIETNKSSTEITITSTILIPRDTITSSFMNTSNNTYYFTTNTISQTSNSITVTSSVINTTNTSITLPPTSPTPPFQPESCNSSLEVRLDNNTCILKSVAQANSVNTIRSNSNDSNEKANALHLYFRSANTLTKISNTSGILTPREVDEVVNGLNGDIVRNGSTLFIMSQPTSNETDAVKGALSQYTSNHIFIQQNTVSSIDDFNFSAAAFISNQPINNINSVKLFIVGEPTAYKGLDSSSDQSLASPVIVAAVQRSGSASTPINISLYFTVLPEYRPNVSATYRCSFYDTTNSRWNESGCTEPQHNTIYDRYSCTCNHLTTFALIWLPNIPLVNYLTAQDIASLVFLSISILCFIAVIIHSLIIRFINPRMSFGPRDLLPLISSASTAILFIFFIALSMTVYTRTLTVSSVPTPCFRSASVLMFFVYFFLIFMFCAKTSIGYFNYLRFVHLFPEPSNRKLVVLLIISFFISITWTSFAAGFNSNVLFSITQIHGNKLCWFTRDAIYYFLTIPVCIFLLLNFITIIFVTKRIIDHVRRATSPHQSYQRMKRCVLILLSSCVTQGIGWLFGPFITIVDPTTADVLGWFFIIFNGLEGIWTILLYIIIRSQRIEESKRVSASKKDITSTSSGSVKSKRKRSDLNSVTSSRFQVTSRSAQKEQFVFQDLYDEEFTDWETSTSEL